MDPFTVSTAIIPLISLAATCLSTCYRYGCTVSSAQTESKQLVSELTSLSGVLVGVQGVAQDDIFSSLSTNAPGNLENLLGECKIVLEETLGQIERAMGNGDGGRTGGKGKVMKTMVKRALWPLQKQDTLDLIAKVERTKTKLTMMLTTVSTQLILQQQSVISDMAVNVQDMTTQMQTESKVAKREKVLDWLTTHNPNAAHQRAVRAYCEDTCSWILQEDAFQQWLNSSDHCALWLNGLAGYGKTIMTSFIIQHLLNDTDLSRFKLAYYYFDVGDAVSLSLQTFLASIIRQYCTAMASLPDRIVDEFDAQQARYGSTRQLEVEELAGILDDLLSAHPSNVIVVDGIDESSEQEDVCDVLNALAAADGLVHLFVSSRPEAAIRRGLTQFTEIEMSQGALESDIGQYVKTRMAKEPRLARLNPKVKQHTQNTIQERSHGMFRWAQCQLDDISKLRTDRAVRQALSVLPQNIGDLYSLMLGRIPQSDVELARKALMILAHSPSTINIYAVAEAAIFEPSNGRIEADDRLGDPHDILEICGSLVAYDPVLKEIRLAHHSVRECLERLQPEQSPFAMLEQACHRELAIICLNYLVLDDFSGGFKKTMYDLLDTIEAFPLLPYAAQNVCHHIQKSGYEDELQPLILKLFSKDANPWFLLWLQLVCWVSSDGVFEIPGSDIAAPQPLYYASSYGLIHTVKSLVRDGANMDAKAGRYGGTALHAAFWRGHPEVARFLLESGVDPNIKDFNEMGAYELVLFHSDPTLVELAFEYSRNKPAREIPESLTSAVNQVYSRQGLTLRTNHPNSGRKTRNFVGFGHKQHWQAHQPEKLEGAEEQIFEID